MLSRILEPKSRNLDGNYKVVIYPSQLWELWNNPGLSKKPTPKRGPPWEDHLMDNSYMNGGSYPDGRETYFPAISI